MRLLAVTIGAELRVDGRPIVGVARWAAPKPACLKRQLWRLGGARGREAGVAGAAEMVLVAKAEATAGAAEAVEKVMVATEAVIKVAEKAAVEEDASKVGGRAAAGNVVSSAVRAAEVAKWVAVATAAAPVAEAKVEAREAAAGAVAVPAAAARAEEVRAVAEMAVATEAVEMRCASVEKEAWAEVGVMVLMVEAVVGLVVVVMAWRQRRGRRWW